MVGFKNRYLVLEIFVYSPKTTTTDELTQPNIARAIKESILVNFGECGLASSLGSFQVKYMNPVTKLCIIRASREDYKKVWCAITMVSSVANCAVAFNLLKLSGSIKACKKAAVSIEEVKYEQHKLLKGHNNVDELNQQKQKCIERIKVLEH